MSLLREYFPEFSDNQISQLECLESLYKYWNSKINVISRKDIENIMIHHVLHSMSIAKLIQFKKNAKIMDLGTGGGFPGIPLAIIFPDTEFHLVDSIGKKIKVCDNIMGELQLKNVKTFHCRAEQINESYDFIVTRAVALLSKLLNWSSKKISSQNNHNFKNGIFALKGIDNAKREIEEINKKNHSEIYLLSDFFKDEYFSTKCLLYCPLK